MRLTDELDRGLHHDAPGVRLKFWGGTDFLSIAVALDTLMESMGWLKQNR